MAPIICTDQSKLSRHPSSVQTNLHYLNLRVWSVNMNAKWRKRAVSQKSSKNPRQYIYITEQREAIYLHNWTEWEVKVWTKRAAMPEQKEQQMPEQNEQQLPEQNEQCLNRMSIICMNRKNSNCLNTKSINCMNRKNSNCQTEKARAI